MGGKYSDSVLGGTTVSKAKRKYADRVLGGSKVTDQPNQDESLLDPNIVERASFLPFGKTKAGETVFALPGIGVGVVGDVLKAIGLPGRAWRGEPISEADITQSALTVGVPALRGLGGTAIKKVPGKITRRQVKEAPTMEQLKTQGSALFERAKGASAIVSPDSFQNILVKVEKDIFADAFDPGLHPKVAAAMNALGKRLGKDMDMQELMITRRLAKNAADSIDPDEARIGNGMVDNIDEYVEGLGDDDLISGAMEGAASNLREARKLWAKMRKREMIDDIFEKAENQASGLENGVRIQLRSLLNNKRKLRGFTPDEISLMKDVVRGNIVTNSLKLIGKLGPGVGQQKNLVGLAIGAGGGAAAFGPVGAVAVPAGGWLAQKGGEKLTLGMAERLRALTSAPPRGMMRIPYGTQGISRAMTGLALGRMADPQRKRGRLESELRRR